MGLGAAGALPWFHAFLGQAASEHGDLDSLGWLAEQAEALFVTMPTPLANGILTGARAHLARLRNDLDAADDLAHQALAFLADAGTKLPLVDALELVASLACAFESDKEAVRLLGAAETARTAIGYARFPGQRAQFESSVETARSRLSEDGFLEAWSEGVGMTLDAAVAYTRRGRGERKRPSVGWASLTPAEVDVVRAVAEGLTNAQIAKRLFVTPNTVKTHLQHVYTKLGIGSRAELAAAVARRPL
jgi:DNA-binding CsgD family transcriptional regulator